jgi:hypothetical protein
MKRVLSEKKNLRELFNSHQVTPQDYFVQAGFDEDLLDNGAGHLEEIYIYLIKEVEVQVSGMLDDLAKVFHPFPCVLLTPDNSYRTPMHPELPLGFDSVILERTDRYYQILELTNHLEWRGSSKPMIDGESTYGGGGDGNSRQDGGSAGDSGGGSGNRDDDNQYIPPNSGPPGPGGGDDGGAGKAPIDGDNDEPSDKEGQSSVVEAKGKIGIPEVVCHSHVEVHIPKVAISSNPSMKGSPPSPDTLFQKFDMRAVVAVDVGLKYSCRLNTDSH